MATLLRALFAALILVVTAGAAFADDWQATRLRGAVIQLVDGEWVKLKRGDVVPDSRVIRTLKTGHVDLKRGKETIQLGPDTQIRIFDEGGTKPYTTVEQSFGSVSVEAEVRNVQHFAVETPFLAAVVKGTRFTVTSGKTGARVDVKRGVVAVTAAKTGQTINVTPGRSVAIEAGNQIGLVLSGKGLPKDGVAVSQIVQAADGSVTVQIEAGKSGVNVGVGVGVGGVGVGVGLGVGGTPPGSPSPPAIVVDVDLGGGSSSGGGGSSGGGLGIGIGVGIGGIGLNLGL